MKRKEEGPLISSPPFPLKKLRIIALTKMWEGGRKGLRFLLAKVRSETEARAPSKKYVSSVCIHEGCLLLSPQPDLNPGLSYCPGLRLALIGRERGVLQPILLVEEEWAFPPPPFLPRPNPMQFISILFPFSSKRFHSSSCVFFSRVKKSLGESILPSPSRYKRTFPTFEW